MDSVQVQSEMESGVRLSLWLAAQHSLLGLMQPGPTCLASLTPNSEQPQTQSPEQLHLKLCKMPVNNTLMECTDELKPDHSASARTEIKSLEAWKVRNIVRK